MEAGLAVMRACSRQARNMARVRRYLPIAQPASYVSHLGAPAISMEAGPRWGTRRHFGSKRFDAMDAEEEKKVVHAPPMEVEKDVGQALKAIQDTYRKGNFEEALEQSMGLKDFLETQYGEDHPVVASVLNNIALFHKMMGRLDDASLWYSQALHKYKAIVGEKHRSYAATLNNLGLVYLAQAQKASKLEAMGMLDSAEETLRRVLEIRSEILEDDDPALATTRTSLASVLQRKGKTQDAEELLRTALDRVTSRRGRNNEAAATAMNNLAYLLKSLGRLDEAALLYQEALAVRTELFGDAHTDVVIAKNNLAELYRKAGREEQALELQRQILEVLERAEEEGSRKSKR